MSTFRSEAEIQADLTTWYAARTAAAGGLARQQFTLQRGNCFGNVVKVVLADGARTRAC